MDETSSKKKKLITSIEDDFNHYNKPSNFQSFALFPVLFHMILMGFAFCKHTDRLFQPVIIIYTTSLFVTAIVIDVYNMIYKEDTSERTYLLYKGIINFLCFIPLSFYCAIQLYIAVIEFGQHEVTGEAIAFVFSNLIFHFLQWVYIKKDFKCLQKVGKMTHTDPTGLTMNEKKRISAYNIIFYSSVYAIFIAEGLYLIVYNNNYEAIEKLQREWQSSGSDRNPGGALTYICAIVALICVHQFVAIVKIVQAFWTLCTPNPRWQNYVAFV
uniref:Uncharacterized protein n=1 Tax=Panagrellus redivivus TaxID=6233 RepID=A0A7E4WAZ8_PANRE